MPRMTTLEFQAWQARVAANRKAHRLAAANGDGVADGCEDELHAAILGECRRRGWIPLHGQMQFRTRRPLGEPDFVIAIEGGRTLWVEAKTRTGKLSTEQQAFGAYLEKMGHQLHVVRSLEDFLRVVNVLSSETTPSNT